ncbi:NAD(P)/FAD-dependent oxidoreductase [Aeoliella mucimassa]|uniref:NADH:ubiquinone reductase (non-electrogenic) n=1 Tax=Aeoliella mucimassa TaxID=2527972 RepID=A0A518AGK4_9BACT|nr:NAD(P)/FAD-dependent oxidoreductase [Aeoliella mucimassa]QDU53860.1 NADH dehydrogenase-like protein [Aeoliella mucimassa]
MDRTQSAKHRVVIIGGGFGGLQAAQSLKRADVEVTLVDRSNHHLFQPLLYQVATGGLSPANIAAPLRSILERHANTRVLQAEVVGFDLESRTVKLNEGELAYDSLIVAAGSSHSYFGHPEWSSLAPGLKSIENATDMRARILSAFERAERTDDPEERHRLLTFVIVGGGPTGVELAGALSELSRHTLRHEFRSIKSEEATIMLVDAGPRVLGMYSEHLSDEATKSLEKLGVTLCSGKIVTEIAPSHVVLTKDDQHETVGTETVLWAAGVAASPLAKMLADASGQEVDRQGRIAVNEKLDITGHDNVFVIGDMARCLDADGQPLPGLAPVAIQQGKYAAKLIARRSSGKSLKKGFVYRDWGSMATVGRSMAIVQMGKLEFAGYFAWLVWLFVHLMQLVTFENRLLVLFQWAWNYITRNRSARLITNTPVAITTKS